MIPPEAWIGSLGEHGLWIVALASAIEGPIVSVLAAVLASKGAFDLVPLALVLLAGDLLGDLGHYLLGRRGLGRVPLPWRHRLGLGPDRTEALARHFDRHGGRTLVVAKLTHSVGAAVLVAAGLARMPVLPFLAFNLLAALPKTAALMALGWFAGDAYAQIDLWLSRGAFVLLLVLVGLGLIWMRRRPQCPQD
ncbi:VTT domain-containing protein [Rhodobacter sp. Har01]|uniref:DedA family protein n=1 Tax=Rhodobacter sp. Har01 TaxID=2883999 RepID=UPI001D075E37|nr:VTT domain-containing protein [Rhodobacter sp. Har01]MCB6179786.1 VTT domain-containing protein [Rhodobacter sp. Har01]